MPPTQFNQRPLPSTLIKSRRTVYMEAGDLMLAEPGLSLDSAPGVARHLLESHTRPENKKATSLAGEMSMLSQDVGRASKGRLHSSTANRLTSVPLEPQHHFAVEARTPDCASNRAPPPTMFEMRSRGNIHVGRAAIGCALDWVPTRRMPVLCLPLQTPFANQCHHGHFP
ncbi:hypothetical protein GGTG_11980 [Gaeumannomyces tritici R3-111a-1]|uniref:Uncharacterized protein n=1 Tax=Gaeumannomyces tritici (strain R3-111a-1) TaxID=644352 RepID=J3PEP9_GAET3|nr:hypothetical protein GGTG_11980 [Gaeumannomyces tritici R3-111a-1]EJT70957.1 hypothetical protein GGTG_11980 [Gaeumannomyces tritici R3-111a-1]